MKRFLVSDRWRSIISRHAGKVFVAQAVLFALLGMMLVAGFWRAPAAPSDDDTVNVSAIVPAEAGETLWTCSMHPQIRQPKPGKCPLCGMDLIPVAKTAGGLRTLAISSESRALMRIETSPVEKRYVTHEIPLVGRVDYDETRLGYITAWVSGRLDRLYVDFTGVEVKKGDHLVYIYSEQLYAAQEELIQALRNRRARPTRATAIEPIDLLRSAREKLRLLGLTDGQIAEIEARGQPTDHITIYSPLGGIVIEKLKQQGERVQVGERIYTIADLSQVWVHLDAYESDLPWVRYGQDVTISTEAYPGEQFHGRIAFIQPVLNDKTRTVKVRVNAPNSNGKLKPDMFVHAVVQPRVAAGGKVMDANLAGKWISPMHPEIVKDHPGNCDICGMPLVRAETLGYVMPETDSADPPLVIPYRSALVTGSRAVVYVQLPNMPSFAEPALQTLSVVVQERDIRKSREAFAMYANIVDESYDQPGTDFARRMWNEYADRLAKHALAGQRAKSAHEVDDALARIDATMNEIRERFAPPERPTFEGREIVLGPRAGDYFLVRHGLEEGELVVTQGNFKIDAEIQIQAKPSMMTPDGGGGGGHAHGDSGPTAAKPAGDGHTQHTTALPAEFTKQLRKLDDAYQQVVQAVESQDVGKASASFAHFLQILDQVNGSLLTGHSRMLWKEFSMLLGNDALEGSDAKQVEESDRVFLLLKGHMRRLREQLGVTPEQPPQIERIAASPEFQTELARIWEQYLAVSQALAADNFQDARQFVITLESALAAVGDASLADDAREAWVQAREDLARLIQNLKDARDINALRSHFQPLSQMIGRLARTFGFGESGPIYELHCPMAFQGKGAIWYQESDQVRNPYYGATMLTCADRVERLVHYEPGAPAAHDHESSPNHSRH